MNKKQALAGVFQFSVFKWAESSHKLIREMLIAFPGNRESLLRLESKIEPAVDAAIETFNGKNQVEVMRDVETLNKQIVELKQMLDDL